MQIVLAMRLFFEEGKDVLEGSVFDPMKVLARRKRMRARLAQWRGFPWGAIIFTGVRTSAGRIENISCVRDKRFFQTTEIKFDGESLPARLFYLL